MLTDAQDPIILFHFFAALIFAQLAFCAIEIFLRPQRSVEYHGAMMPELLLLRRSAPANAVSAASTCRSWLVKLIFSVLSSITIFSTPVIFAMAGIIAEVLSTCSKNRRRSTPADNSSAWQGSGWL